MQYTEVPHMAFFDCKPVIEKADANITLARGIGPVFAFKILGEPQAQIDPWATHFRHANKLDKEGKIATIRQVSKPSNTLVMRAI
mgnify:CR=1 FL=1